MPSSVLAPLEAAFAVDRHDSTEPLSGEELRERIAGKHGLVCMFGRPHRQCRPRRRRPAESGGHRRRGVRQHRRRGGRGPRHRGHQYAGPRHRRHGRADVGADPVGGLAASARATAPSAAARGGGGRSSSCWGSELRGKQLGVVGAGAHRPRGGGHRPRVRHAAGLRGAPRPGADARGGRRCAGAVARRAAADLRRGVPARAADGRDEAPRGSPDPRPHEALRGARQTRRGAASSTTRPLAWAPRRAGSSPARGLDVFEGEPRVHPGLVGRDNVCLTPPPRQRHPRDPHRDGPARGAQRRRGAAGPAGGHPGRKAVTARGRQVAVHAPASPAPDRSGSAGHYQDVAQTWAQAMSEPGPPTGPGAPARMFAGSMRQGPFEYGPPRRCRDRGTC